jgi:hypothetical protein
MRQYWWVNHKQTFNQEIEHQYLWSPKTSSNGAQAVGIRRDRRVLEQRRVAAA